MRIFRQDLQQGVQQEIAQPQDAQLMGAQPQAAQQANGVHILNKNTPTLQRACVSCRVIQTCFVMIKVRWWVLCAGGYRDSGITNDLAGAKV